MQVDRNQLESDMLQFIQSRCPNSAELMLESNLLEDGILDSLLLMDLIFQIEDRYGIKFGSEQINPSNFRNVSAIADLVLSQMKQMPA